MMGPMKRLRKHRKTSAAGLVWGVVALQVTLVTMFVMDRGEPPAAGTLWQGLWALARRPEFDVLLLLIGAGLPMSYLAYCARGPHRKWLIGAWVIFAAIVAIFFGQRLAVMMQVLWTHRSG